MLGIPLGVGRIWGYARYDWGYVTEPEPNADGRSIEIARGKVIGGSSSINAMGYIRGHRGDYDRWASYGLASWSFAEVLPYFKRAETWEDGESELRGSTGPLYVRRTKVLDPLYDAYMAAGQSAGHPILDDYNGPEQHGFALCQWTIDKGRRGSTSATYLRPALRRKTLVVRTRAHVTRIVIEHERAIGVEYLHRGQRVEVRASARSGRQRRRDQFSATSNALRHRRPGSPCGCRHQTGACVARSRSEFAGSLRHHSGARAQGARAIPPLHPRRPVSARHGAGVSASAAGPRPTCRSGFMAFLKTEPSLALPDFQLLFRVGPAGSRTMVPGTGGRPGRLVRLPAAATAPRKPRRDSAALGRSARDPPSSSRISSQPKRMCARCATPSVSPARSRRNRRSIACAAASYRRARRCAGGCRDRRACARDPGSPRIIPAAPARWGLQTAR